MMMRLLVSVRSVDEALVAARGGADFIDLKQPDGGALGGLPTATIAAIVAALRAQGLTQPVSATIGDWPMSARTEIARRVDAVGRCGVAIVKVGIDGCDVGSRAVLSMLAAGAWAVAPVFIADRGLDLALVAHAAALGFAAVMADTADKQGGSLIERVPREQLHAFVRTVRDRGVPVGLAGALRAHHADVLATLAPDFAGFRGAVCVHGERSGALDAQRLYQLRTALAQAQGAIVGAGPSSSERMRASSAQ